MKLPLRQRFKQALVQTSPRPLALEVEAAEGCYILGREGRRYFDCISGIGVSSLGHKHPKVLAAIHNQADKYLHTMVYGEYIQLPQVEYAEALLATLPTNINSVYFTNSGSEATEGAMKLAKKATGRAGFVACNSAYHGSTQGALSLAEGSCLQDGYAPLLPNCTSINYNDVQALSAIDESTAAFVVEVVNAESGVTIGEKVFLREAASKCKQVGALLIVDEIQTGFGRTGCMWAIDDLALVPDIMLLGKALGGGLPLGAFVADIKHSALLSKDPVLGHITTFGGHPLSCAAGLAAFQALAEEGVVAAVAEKGRLLFSKLAQQLTNYRIRHRGLLGAIQLESESHNERAVELCYAEGVLVDWFLYNSSAIRVAPPLVATTQELEWVADVIAEAVLATQGRA